MPNQPPFILGLDLDGVVADFYGYIRIVAAEWRGVDVDQLTEEVRYGLGEWKFTHYEYRRLHRFAVKERDLFAAMNPIKGAAQALRQLSAEKVYIRIITDRLVIPYFHSVAVEQTVRWLENHAVPYRDLCFTGDKCNVGAHIYIDDSPKNIEALRAKGKKVIIYTNSTNRMLRDDPGGRAVNWNQAGDLIRRAYHDWCYENELPIPEADCPSDA